MQVISKSFKLSLLIAIILFSRPLICQNLQTQIIKVGEGWAGNSINTAIFRQNSITSFKDTQYIAWYDAEGAVILGKRKIGQNNWETQKTQYKGNILDAHNSISIMVDDNGFLHMSWDHHNNELRYCKSISPGLLEMGANIPMTGKFEKKVTYPQFFKLLNGNLIFLYRDGGSGHGNLIVNKYDLKSQTWTQLHSNLIDGEGKRNAYWQAVTDSFGGIHLSWVWRESPDVASNHDLCYAYSKDGGVTWVKSSGEKYVLPIKEASAEVVKRIPQNSELINQTSMTVTKNGQPIIVSYWREKDSMIPQYHLVYKENKEWKSVNLNFRKSAFTLSGVGSKRIPISRPVILSRDNGKSIEAYLIFRDEERGSKASVAIAKDVTKNQWEILDLSNEDLGSWEPTFDTNLWEEKGILNLFVQKVTQIDNEGKADVPVEQVKVLEWNPNNTLIK